MQSELFGTSVEVVMGKFREVKAYSAAFKSCISRQSESTPKQPGGPGPSQFKDRKQGQKSSVVSQDPPLQRNRSRRRRDARKRKQDLRKVIQRSEAVLPSEGLHNPPSSLPLAPVPFSSKALITSGLSLSLFHHLEPF